METPILAKAIEHLVRTWGPISGRTRMQNLVYLSDRRWFRREGSTATGARYTLWTHGPFSREVVETIEWMDGVEILVEQRRTSKGITTRYSSGEFSRLNLLTLEPRFAADLDYVFAKFGAISLRELTERVHGLPEIRDAIFGQRLLN